MKLTKRQKYDYRDIDRIELLLIKIGHHVWRLYKRESLALGGSVSTAQAYLEACKDIWKAKREYREELKLKRAAGFAKWKATLLR